VFPIDGHVHFHDRARVEPTLNAALANFRAAAAASGNGPAGALLLAQTAGEQVFEWLREQTRVGRWTVKAVAAEPEALWLAAEDVRLLAVCGRQIATGHGLEVLALGTDARFDDGNALEPTLDRVRACGALAVLPWGFGKWLGRRGEQIRSLIAARARDDLWLGDNGGRLRGLRRPRLLDEGEHAGMRVLSGTDPLPVGRDYRRTGSFGFLLPGAVDRLRPWASIAASLRSLRSSPPAYGRGTGWLRFGANQARMQVHKRLRLK
jgi:hypothetical protein